MSISLIPQITNFNPAQNMTQQITKIEHPQKHITLAKTQK